MHESRRWHATSQLDHDIPRRSIHLLLRAARGRIHHCRDAQLRKTRGIRLVVRLQAQQYCAKWWLGSCGNDLCALTHRFFAKSVAAASMLAAIAGTNLLGLTGSGKLDSSFGKCGHIHPRQRAAFALWLLFNDLPSMLRDNREAIMFFTSTGLSIGRHRSKQR